MDRYDSRTALVVVDVQNDFADPEGSLYVDGGEEILPEVNREIASAREAGALVVYTRDWHPESTPHFEKDGGIWPVHCVDGTWGSRFHPRLTIAGPEVKKGTGSEDGYSGFTDRDVDTGTAATTGLEALLRERAIERVVVVGLALDYCVKATALDACRLGFETTVPLAATRPVELTPGDGDRALEELQAAGARIV